MKAGNLIGPAYLAMALLIGGSAQGLWSNLFLLAAGLVVIGIILMKADTARWTGRARPVLMIGGLGIAWALLQLVPLPPAIWQNLPGREIVATGFHLAGSPLPWMPISLVPDRAVGALLALIPAVATFMAVMDMRGKDGGSYTIAMLAVLAVAIPLGIMQKLWGWGYLYQFTNIGTATGFFANSNHFATLLLVAIPCLCALAAMRGLRLQGLFRNTEIAPIFLLALAVLASGIVANGSNAIILLGPPVLFASLLLMALRRSVRVMRLAMLSLILGFLAVVLAILLSTQAETTDVQLALGLRLGFWARTLELVQAFGWPGTGLGTFADLYPMAQDPTLIDQFYVNHAHNDYLELLLELGIPGAILITTFLIWWFKRTIQLWQGREEDYFARAATIASGVIILHSIVDFPLRTGAHMAIFGLCLALMVTGGGRFFSEKAKSVTARHLKLEDLD